MLRELQESIIPFTLKLDACVDMGPIFVGSTGKGAAYLAGGWHNTESWGVWSEGKTATIMLPVQDIPANTDLDLILNWFSYLTPRRPEISVTVHAVGDKLADLKYTREKHENEAEIVHIPAATIAKAKNELLYIVFDFDSPAAPKDFTDDNLDSRIIGMGLRSFELLTAP